MTLYLSSLKYSCTWQKCLVLLSTSPYLENPLRLNDRLLQTTFIWRKLTHYSANNDNFCKANKRMLVYLRTAVQQMTCFISAIEIWTIESIHFHRHNVQYDTPFWISCANRWAQYYIETTSTLFLLRQRYQWLIRIKENGFKNFSA